MTTELYWLTLTALMTALFWVPYVLNRVAATGLGGTLAGSAPDAGKLAEWAQRAIRAHTNAVENLAIFAPIVLTAHVLGISNPATKAAVVVYFFARLAHLRRLRGRHSRRAHADLHRRLARTDRDHRQHPALDLRR